MTLARVHRILIVSAVILGLLYAARGVWAYRTTGNAWELALAALSAAAAVALLRYLRWFRAKAGGPGPSGRAAPQG